MEAKKYRIVGENYTLWDEDTFLAKIELAPVSAEDDAEHVYVSLIVMDGDAVSYRVDNFDFCKRLVDHWESSGPDPDPFSEENAKEDYEYFEETEASPYRVFFCMLENLCNAAHSTYTVVTE